MGAREGGFLKMREYVLGLARPAVIVETGCMRGATDLYRDGDGHSTKILCALAKEVGGRLISIDIEPKHCDLAQEICPEARVICGDAVQELYRLNEWIDLLYLDSMDGDWNQMHPSALHHLKELCAAGKLLRPGSAVWVDDNREDGLGKGMYCREYLKAIGAVQIHDAYQIGFVMP